MTCDESIPRPISGNPVPILFPIHLSFSYSIRLLTRLVSEKDYHLNVSLKVKLIDFIISIDEKSIIKYHDANSRVKVS